MIVWVLLDSLNICEYQKIYFMIIWVPFKDFTIFFFIYVRANYIGWMLKFLLLFLFQSHQEVKWHFTTILCLELMIIQVKAMKYQMREWQYDTSIVLPSKIWHYHSDAPTISIQWCGYQVNTCDMRKLIELWLMTLVSSSNYQVTY